MKKGNLLLTALSLACAVGCITEDQPKPPTTETEPLISVPGEPAFKLYQKAMEAEKAGKYRDAARFYLEVEKVGDREFYEAAVMSRARVFMMTNDNDAALYALDPLPEEPRTFFECRKLAMAARILAKRGDFKDAEAMFAVAVHETPVMASTEVFRAETLVALHQVYVQNKNPEKALSSIRLAAELYEKNGLQKQAKECREIVKYMTTP